MSTIVNKREYKCYNGCTGLGGCNGHELEIRIQTTSDVMCIKKDDQETWFDPTDWKQVTDILGNLDYPFFDLTYENYEK